MRTVRDASDRVRAEGDAPEHVALLDAECDAFGSADSAASEMSHEDLKAFLLRGSVEGESAAIRRAFDLALMLVIGTCTIDWVAALYAVL
jgi:hypothetical protein